MHRFTSILAISIIAVALGFATAGPVRAADHLFTAVNAGGLTMANQPFQNGVNNPGRSGLTVPGQGSPNSGCDTTVPAVETTFLPSNANPGNGAVRPLPASAVHTVPTGSMNSCTP